MNGKNINLNDKIIKKSDFYNNKNKIIFNIDDIDVNKILVSKKEQYGKYNSFKYFIGYNDNDVIRSLCLKLSEMTGYINKFDENKNKITMSLKVKDKQLLKITVKYGKKSERLMNIDFESKPTYGDDDKYIITKIKTYGDSITTSFNNKRWSKKIPEEKVPCKCLSIIILDSVLYAYKKCHPQTFLEECKHEQKIKTKNYIDEEFKSESSTDTDTDNKE